MTVNLCDILEPSSIFETPTDNTCDLSNEQTHHHMEEMFNEEDIVDGNMKLQVNKDKQSLPEGIKIIETILLGVSHYGVFCSEKMIKKGTRFGPFTGRNIAPNDIFTLSDTSYTWEVSIEIRHKVTDIAELDYSCTYRVSQKKCPLSTFELDFLSLGHNRESLISI